MFFENKNRTIYMYFECRTFDFSLQVLSRLM